MNAHALAAQVILNRQSTLPIFTMPILGRQRSVHVFEQRLGVMPGERERHDLWRRHRLLNRNALRAGDGWQTRSLRVAGAQEVVSDGAALNVIFGAPRAIGDNFAFLVAVFGGIAVDQDGRRALLLRSKRLESTIAVRIRVAHEHDLAFDVDALLAQQSIVVGIAAVRVDNWGGGVARY